VTPAASFTGDADVIFTDGVILTMEANSPIVEGIAIQGDRIIAVGTNEEVLRQRGDHTSLVSLEGHTLIPGFVDAHSHLGQTAQGSAEKFKQLQQDAIRGGITTTTEMYVDADVLDQLKEFDRAGLMRLRWNTYLLYNTNCGDPVERTWHTTYKQGEDISAHIRNQGVKLFSDGGSCHVPAVSFEYAGGYGHGDLFLTQDQVTAAVKEVQAFGSQIAIHALGDRAVEEAQNAIAAALDGTPNTFRHRIEHNAVLRPDLLPRYNQIGIVAVIFGSYATCWRINPNSQFKYVVPEDLGTWEWPWRALLDANPGIKAAWHSDFPVFPDISPMAHLYGFVTRDQVATDGSICQAPDWLEHGAITVSEALLMMTINSAFALFRENEIGSLATGKLADMLVLSENPLEVRPETIKDIQVLMTMIAGKVENCAPGSEKFCPAAVPAGLNTSPFGFVDIPAPEATVSGTVEIAGWALDEAGIDKVEIYIDGKFVGTAVYGNPRPDVDHDYPGRPGAPNFGFSYSMDTTTYRDGRHTIQAVAISSSGGKGPLQPEMVTITINN
jgi:predicted amidohydrolase YtcJ